MAEPKKSLPYVKLGLLLVAVSIAVVLFATGAHESVSPNEAREWLRASGAWGPAVFIIAFAVLQPFGFPAHAFILTAALVWDPWQAFTFSWAGAMAASCTSFGFARYVGHDWVQDRVPEKLKRYDERLATHGFRTVLVMRLIFFTFGPMQLMLGISRVRFWHFLMASAIGLAPVIAAESWLGGSLVDWLLKV